MEILGQFKLAIFDLDGTLVDSLPNNVSIVEKMLLRRGHKTNLCPEEMKRTVSRGAPIIAQTWFSGEIEKDVVREFRKLYAEEKTDPNQVYRGARDYIHTLKEKGWLCAICSNKPEELCRVVLRDVHLQNSFDLIVGGDSLRERKPSPMPLRFICSRLDIAIHESIFLGDSSLDMQAAEGAGMKYLHHKYGYETVGLKSLDEFDFEELNKEMKEEW